MKRKVDSGSPCQRPHEAWIFPLNLPLTMMEKFVMKCSQLSIPAILNQSLLLQECFRGISNRHCQRPFCFFLFHSSRSSFVMHASRIYHPFTRAIYCLVLVKQRTLLRFFYSTLAMILYSPFIRLMWRKSATA